MLKDNILLALSELKSNKMRSLLTMLGIVRHRFGNFHNDHGRGNEKNHR